MVNEALFRDFKQRIKKYEENIQKENEIIKMHKEKIQGHVKAIITIRNEMFFNGRDLFFKACGYDHIPVYKITYDGLGEPDDIITVCADCMKIPAFKSGIIKEEVL